jgi:phytoene/squalene synthetase
MTLQACADLVHRGDPDRFAAAMAVPVAARRVLFPLYAFNVEVARAPWVASEPMIGEMRLQWWRDALEETGEGRAVRRHEVTTPLAEVIDAHAAQLLDRLVAARRWDLYSDAFEDEEHFRAYLDRTGGALMWVAARALGAEEACAGAVRRFGSAAALVRFMRAVPELEARGRMPLVDGRPAAVRALAEDAMRDVAGLGDLKRGLPPLARAALIEGWQTRALLRQITREPGRVAEGRVGLSEFRSRAGLFLAASRL